MRRAQSQLLCVCAGAAALVVSSQAAAGNGYEFPENGAEQLGRAGAWVARASNPLATFYNPAGLATQRTGVNLSASLIWQKTCFKRRAGDGSVETFQEGSYTYAPEVCNSDSSTPFVNPQLGFTWRVSEKLGIGIAVMGPSARGSFEYPTNATGASTSLRQPVSAASPQRYMMMNDDLLFIWPQIGVGYSVLPNLQIGGSFIWGYARMKFSAMASGQAVPTTNGTDGYDQDVRARLDVKDTFVPGATGGVLYSPASNWDVGGWFHWSDSIRAKGSVELTAPVYTSSQKLNDNPTRSYFGGDSVKVTAPWPMEARLGVRYHQPRKDALVSEAQPSVALRGTPTYRDPLAHDAWDIEVDLTWANNSQFQNLDIRLPAKAQVQIADPQLPGSTISLEMPTDASMRHGWKDTYGIRVGGDYVVIPSRFAVRAGGFFQTSGQDPAYLNIDYVPSQMFGLNAGATARFGSFDATVGFGHVFFAGLDNHGVGQLHGLAGTQGQYGNRTNHAVNGGSNSSSVNIVSLGAGYSF